MMAGQSLTAQEKRDLPVLDVAPESLISKGKTNPFNQGQRIFRYRPADLKFQPSNEPTARTKAFTAALMSMSHKLGGVVPYAFCLSDGSARSLDAGCLGFLYNQTPSQITFETDDAGYIVGVHFRQTRGGEVGASDRNDAQRYSIPWLIAVGKKPAFQALIKAAEEGGLLTYGQLADDLRRALANPRISPRNMGWVVGSLMDDILRVETQAPLINLLVVRQGSKQPGEGADPYLRRRYGRAATPRARRDQVQQGMNEAWMYRGRWQALYWRLFQEDWQTPSDDDQFDRDGQSDNPRHSGEPESLEHKRLKQFVLDNPSALRLGLADPKGAIESPLLSGDRMDVEFVDGARRIGIEVKSIRSGWMDLRRGVYQCVKYRAVMAAQSGFEPDVANCSAVLVTERQLPSDLAELARRLKVPHRVVRCNV